MSYYKVSYYNKLSYDENKCSYVEPKFLMFQFLLQKDIRYKRFKQVLQCMKKVKLSLENFYITTFS